MISCATSPPSTTQDICKIFKEKKSWYRAAKKTEKRWKIPISVSMAFIKQESSFVADAKPPRTRLLGFIPWKRKSSAKGYAQAIDGTWDLYIKERGGWFTERNDFEDAVIEYLKREHGEENFEEVGSDHNDSKSLEKAKKTLELMKAGTPF